MRLKSDPNKDFHGGIIGSGTKLQAEDTTIFLDADLEEIVFLSEITGSLSITASNMTVELNDSESQNLVVRSNPENVVADNTVTIPVKGLFQRPQDHPKSTSRSAGFAFRGLYRKWQINKVFKAIKKS